MIDARIIESLALFAGLAPAARAVLAARGSLRRVRDGEALWQAGETPSGLHVVVSGEVRVVRSVGSRQHVVHTEHAGGTLGDVPLFDGSPSPATPMAVGDCVCAVFTRDVLTEAIAADARLALILLERLARRLRLVIARLDGASALTVTERLAKYLLAAHARAGGHTFQVGATQTAVAEELGTVREVLVRAMRGLRQRGLIASAGRGRVRVADIAGLRRLAGAAEEQ